MLIRYNGPKAKKYDTIAGTGLVWTPEQPVHDVDEKAAAILLKPPTVFTADGEEPAKVVAPSGTLEELAAKAAAEEAARRDAEEKAALIQKDASQDKKDDDGLPPPSALDPLAVARAEAKAMGLNVHHNAKLETVLKAIADHKAKG